MDFKQKERIFFSSMYIVSGGVAFLLSVLIPYDIVSIIVSAVFLVLGVILVILARTGKYKWKGKYPPYSQPAIIALITVFSIFGIVLLTMYVLFAHIMSIFTVMPLLFAISCLGYVGYFVWYYLNQDALIAQT